MSRNPGQGNYSRLTPAEIEERLGEIDFAIFDLLPDEGTKVGFSQLFLSSRHLTKRLNDMQPPEAPRITAGQLGSRLGALAHGELVVPVRVTIGGHVDGYQRTARAAELLSERAALEAESHRSSPPEIDDLAPPQWARGRGA